MWINNEFKHDDVVTHILDPRPEMKGIIDAITIERPTTKTQPLVKYRVMWGAGSYSVEEGRHLKIVGTLNRDGIEDIDDYPYGE